MESDEFHVVFVDDPEEAAKQRRIVAEIMKNEDPIEDSTETRTDGIEELAHGKEDRSHCTLKTPNPVNDLQADGTPMSGPWTGRR